jgi:hypothetical protein
MSLDFNRPEVLEPPSFPPTCCVQKTITVTEEVTAKTAQRHDYPSKAHRLSYARRTAAERTFGWLQDSATVGMRRGWSRLMGRAKNHLTYVLGVVVRNVRIVESFERNKAKEALREARRLQKRSRARRRRSCEQERGFGEPAPAKPG